MKKIAFICVVILTVACTEAPLEPSVDRVPVNPDAVAFSAAIRSATRATDIAFEEGDEISVFATEKNTLQSSNYAQNVKYVYTDALFATSENLTYPDEYTYLSFYAVYPYDTYSTPDFTFSVNKDQSSNDTYTQSDLMTASQVARNQDIVDLTFNHRMAKVVINLNSSNLPAGDQEVVFDNVQYNALADLSVNTFKGTGAKTEVIACPNGTNSFKVILPPQTIRKGTEFVTVTIGNKSYLWTVEADLILTSGVEYTYTLTLKENNVSFTSDINPWNPPSEIEAVIPDAYIDLLSPYIPIYEGNTPPDIEGVWYISPLELYYDSNGAERDDFNFAPNYVHFYNQTSDNTLSMESTQNLGDYSIAEGVFVSGSGNNFTVYFNEYKTQEDGSWSVMATLISGTKSGSTIKNYREAFIVLDDYDVNGKYMDTGDFRVVEDADYTSGKTSWPLDTRVYIDGDLKVLKK